MTTRHTPGPWRVVEEYDGSRTIAILRDFRKYTRVGLHVTADHDWVGDASTDRLLANARLVAAAPDLLVALTRALETIRAFHGIGLPSEAEPAVWALYQQSPEMQAITATIAKAYGEAP
jgi:hypothetical protein